MIDLSFLGNQLSTGQMSKLFDEDALIRSWMQAEAALAGAEAAVGLIPAEAARIIRERATRMDWDREALAQGIAQTLHPLIPAIRLLADACGDAGAYVHWGATTQDITDTGLILQVREALTLLQQHITAVRDRWQALALRYRDTPMPGRTHGQHGPPITFGFKVAVWVAEMHRHLERLAACRARLLVGQLAGATGTLASLGPQGLEVQRLMMEELGLGVPPICWHTAHDNFAEFVGMLGMVCGTLGKAALEIVHLQATEVAEVEEAFAQGRVGSSTMPHKRNPTICEGIVSLCHLVRQDTALALGSLVQEHERDMAAQTQWAYLPHACVLTDSALTLSIWVAQGLRVNTQRMYANLTLTGGLAFSEAVMLELGRFLGRQRAHEVIYRISMHVVEHGGSFREALQNAPEIQAHLSPERIEALLQPEQYLGSASACVERVMDITK